MIVHRTRDDGTPIEVELTEAEAEANAAWNRLLEDGSGIAAATDIVESEYPGLDPAFYDYLRR